MTKSELILALADLPNDADVMMVSRNHRNGIANIEFVEVYLDKDENLISDIDANGEPIYSAPYASIWGEEV